LEVDDEGAQYPLVVDPVWSQQTLLTASDGNAGDQFGSSVAVNGNTAVVGTPGKNQNQGAAYVFVSSGGLWTQTCSSPSTCRCSKKDLIMRPRLLLADDHTFVAGRNSNVAGARV
jgi:uncharacterized protein (DUF2345 family)